MKKALKKCGTKQLSRCARIKSRFNMMLVNATADVKDALRKSQFVTAKDGNIARPDSQEPVTPPASIASGSWQRTEMTYARSSTVSTEASSNPP